MNDLIIISIVFGYFVIGAITAGLVKRIDDGQLAAPMFVLWPVFGPIVLLTLLYLWVAGEL